MKLKKRLIALAVMFVILASNVSFAEQEFTKKQYKLPDDIAETSFMGSIAYLDGNINALVDGNSIYRLKKGDEYFSFYAKDETEKSINGGSNIDRIYTDGESLYGLCISSGEFFKAGEKGGALVRSDSVKLNMENHKQTYEDENGDEISYNDYPQDSMLYDGKLFAIYHGDWFSGATLSAFDIKTGEETVYDLKNIKSMAPYKDGKLLIVTQNMEKFYESDDPKDAEATLSVFDPKDESLEEIGPMLIQDEPRDFNNAIIYDKNRETVMYFTDSGLMLRNDDASAKKCAHFPQMFSFYGNDSYVLLPEDRIAITIENSVYIESTDPANLPTKSLVCYNTFSQNHEYVLKQMLDTAITMNDQEFYSNAQELGQVLVSGTNAVDIFQLDLSLIDTNSIINKGYALDITEVEGVKEFVDSLYPYIKEKCIRNDKIYALPVYMYNYAFTQNKQLLKDLDISVPKTFEEMCSLLADWFKDEERASQYLFTDDPDIKRFMWSMLFRLYSDHAYASGEELKYDTPLFRAMAEQLTEALNNMPEQFEFDPEANYEEFYSKPILFGSNGLDLYEMAYEEENKKWFELLAENPLLADDLEKSDSYLQPMDYLEIKASEDSPEGLSLEMALVFANAKTQDPENAKKYMEYFVEGYSNDDKLRLLKDFREPKLNKYYEKAIKDYSERIESAKKELEKAEGAEKTQLEKNLAKMEIRYNLMLEGYGKYVYTQETVDKYKSYLNNVYVLDYDKNQASWQEQIMSLKNRLIDGQIDLEMFIKEIDAKLNLIRLENQ